MRAIILKPLINEKSMMLAKNEFYTFLIDLDATKDQVAKIITEKFGVKVLSVRTVTLPSKTKNQRSRKGKYATGKTKKAIVQVGKGQRIALFEDATKEPAESHSAKASRDGEVEVRTAEGESMGTVKEKKSFLSGTKVKIEKNNEKLAGQKAKVEKEVTINQTQSAKQKGEK